MIKKSDTYKKYQDNTKIISWIHSHFPSQQHGRCQFSGEDAHMQFSWELKYPDIISIIVEHTEVPMSQVANRELEFYKFYKLTEIGKSKVSQCKEGFKCCDRHHKPVDQSYFFKPQVNLTYSVQIKILDFKSIVKPYLQTNAGSPPLFNKNNYATLPSPPSPDHYLDAKKEVHIYLNETYFTIEFLLLYLTFQKEDLGQFIKDRKIACKSCGKLFKNVLNHVNAKKECLQEYTDTEMEHLKKVILLREKQRKSNWYKLNSSNVKETTAKRLQNRTKEQIFNEKARKKISDQRRWANRSKHQVEMGKKKQKEYYSKWTKEKKLGQAEQDHAIEVKDKDHYDSLNIFLKDQRFAKSFNLLGAKSRIMRHMSGKKIDIRSRLKSEDKISKLIHKSKLLDICDLHVFFDMKIDTLGDTLEANVKKVFESLEGIEIIYEEDYNLVTDRIRNLNSHVFHCFKLLDKLIHDVIKGALEDPNSFDSTVVGSKIELFDKALTEAMGFYDHGLLEGKNHIDYKKVVLEFKDHCQNMLKTIFKKYSIWTKKYQERFAQMDEWHNGDKMLHDLSKTLEKTVKECHEEVEEFQSHMAKTDEQNWGDEILGENLTKILHHIACGMEAKSDTIRMNLWFDIHYVDDKLLSYGVEFDHNFEETWFGYYPLKYENMMKESHKTTAERFYTLGRKNVVEFMKAKDIPIGQFENRKLHVSKRI